MRSLSVWCAALLAPRGHGVRKDGPVLPSGLPRPLAGIYMDIGAAPEEEPLPRVDGVPDPGCPRAPELDRGHVAIPGKPDTFRKYMSVETWMERRARPRATSRPSRDWLVQPGDGDPAAVQKPTPARVREAPSSSSVPRLTPSSATSSARTPRPAATRSARSAPLRSAPGRRSGDHRPRVGRHLGRDPRRHKSAPGRGEARSRRTLRRSRSRGTRPRRSRGPIEPKRSTPPATAGGA